MSATFKDKHIDIGRKLIHIMYVPPDAIILQSFILINDETQFNYTLSYSFAVVQRTDELN